MAAVGMMLLYGLVNCGSSLPSGGGGGHRRYQRHLPERRHSPDCSPDDCAGRSGGDVGGHGGAAGDPFGCICDGTPLACRGEAGCSGLLGQGGTGGGGAAGTGGSGGSAGGGGSAGSGGISGNEATPPETIPAASRIFTRGVRARGRQESSGDAGSASRQCYASGVQALVKPAQPFQCNSTPFVDYSQVTDIYDSNGSLCYSIETACYCGQACETFWTFWRNAAGVVVAVSSQAREYAASCVPVADASAPTSTCANPESRQACTAGSCP